MGEIKRPQTPRDAWTAMVSGNHRFVTGAPAHPRQDIDLRAALVEEQRPFAALFGCADSRLSAEIIFDVGLGDLFVVRNAGQVIGETILGSLEYSVEVLEVPLILVLGHDECGAIRATLDDIAGNLPASGKFIHHLVDQIRPTVLEANAAGKTEIETPWDETAIFDLRFVQIAQSLLFMRSGEPMQELQRTAAGEWFLRSLIVGED